MGRRALRCFGRREERERRYSDRRGRRETDRWRGNEKRS